MRCISRLLWLCLAFLQGVQWLEKIAGCRISGMTGPLAKFTNGHSFVLEKRFSQPVSCFWPHIKTGSKISVSCRIPNIHPIPDTKGSPLQPTYDCDMPMHSNNESDYRDRDDPVVASQPFSVFDYTEPYPTLFNLARFQRIWTDGCDLEVHVGLSERHNGASPLCAKLWIQWGGHWVLQCPCDSNETDLP